jgi:hypothetical protein
MVLREQVGHDPAHGVTDQIHWAKSQCVQEMEHNSLHEFERVLPRPGGGRSVGGNCDVQQLLVESGAGEQCGPGVGPVLAGEIAEGTAGLLDDGDQRGDVPRTGGRRGIRRSPVEPRSDC